MHFGRLRVAANETRQPTGSSSNAVTEKLGVVPPTEGHYAGPNGCRNTDKNGDRARRGGSSAAEGDIFQSGQRLPVGSASASISVSIITNTTQTDAVHMMILKQCSGSKFGSPNSVDEFTLRKRPKRGPDKPTLKMQMRAQDIRLVRSRHRG